MYQVPIDADNELSGMMRQLLRYQYAHLVSIRDQLAELEKMLKSLIAEEEAYKRLMQIPGVGPIPNEHLRQYSQNTTSCGGPRQRPGR